MINKSQLFEQLAGKTSTVKTSFGEIKVRSLSFSDIQEIQALNVDGMTASLYFIIRGLVEPELADEDLEKLRKSSPNKILELATVIKEVSGLESEEDFLESTGKTS